MRFRHSALVGCLGDKAHQKLNCISDSQFHLHFHTLCLWICEKVSRLATVTEAKGMYPLIPDYSKTHQHLSMHIRLPNVVSVGIRLYQYLLSPATLRANWMELTPQHATCSEVSVIWKCTSKIWGTTPPKNRGPKKHLFCFSTTSQLIGKYRQKQMQYRHVIRYVNVAPLTGTVVMNHITIITETFLYLSDDGLVKQSFKCPYLASTCPFCSWIGSPM